MNSPKRLTVIFANTWEAFCHLEYVGERMAPQKRTVTIELTQEQRKALVAQKVGSSGGGDHYEEVKDVYFEPEDTKEVTNE